MSNFGRLSKINFTTFFKLFYFPILFFFLIHFKAIFNLFLKAIQTILNLDSNHSSYKSNAPACMHNQVATLYDVF